MVLASVYLSVSSSLPSTANIKPVEVWLLFNLAFPLIIILVNILLQVTKYWEHIEISFIYVMFIGIGEKCQTNHYDGEIWKQNIE